MVDESGDKKQAIFESTLALIKEHGFHGAPMSQVARNAGVAAGTIYHYFESKEQLICALYSDTRERATAVVEQALKEEGSLKDKFYRVWNSLYRFYVKEPNVLIFFEQFVNSPYNANKCPDHFQGELYSFFAAAIKSGALKPVKPQLLLVTVVGSIIAAAKLHLYGQASLTKNDLEHAIDILWTGIKR